MERWLKRAACGRALKAPGPSLSLAVDGQVGIFLALFLGLAAALVVVFPAMARPPEQLALTGVEPRTLSSTAGGTLSIYGSGFTTATVARLVGFGLLDTTFIHSGALRAVVPPGVPPGVYALEVSESGYSATLPAAVTVVAPTALPTPTPVPPPPPPGR
ncbi:MAG: IPT/TIG domain-containing protein, partial [Anaerolineae bacterium]|nr:IPT/TIG domain-containing protein [Anaerolineae bacterium]